MRAHGLDYRGQTVAADMGMGVNPYHGVRAEVGEGLEDSPHIAPFVGAGVELAVGECAGSALAEAVVGVGIEAAGAGDGGYIVLAFVDVLAPLEDNGTAAAADEPQGSEESGGTGSDDDYGRLLRDILTEAVRCGLGRHLPLQVCGQPVAAQDLA